MWKGKIYVVGRYKSTLILQGRNYEPTDIEVLFIFFFFRKEKKLQY